MGAAHGSRQLRPPSSRSGDPAPHRLPSRSHIAAVHAQATTNLPLPRLHAREKGPQHIHSRRRANPCHPQHEPPDLASPGRPPWQPRPRATHHAKPGASTGQHTPDPPPTPSTSCALPCRDSRSRQIRLPPWTPAPTARSPHRSTARQGHAATAASTVARAAGTADRDADAAPWASAAAASPGGLRVPRCRVAAEEEWSPAAAYADRALPGSCEGEVGEEETGGSAT